MTSYYEWAENRGARRHVTPLDVVDVPDYLVLEGDAAGDTIRRHLDRAERDQLSQAQPPSPAP